MAVTVESLSAMQAFVHAAEKRSFKLAGQQVGLTASAIGKAIQRLEEQLAVRLFHRSTRSVTLTEEGMLFLDRCRRIMAELEAAQAELTHAGTTPRGRLKVSLPMASGLLLPVVADFAEAHPGIELDLDIGDRFVDVIEEGFDVVVRSGEPKDSRLLHHRLGRFEWRLVASQAYLDARGTPATLQDLAGHRCLRQRYVETGKLVPWPAEGGPEGLSLPTTVAANAQDPLVLLAEKGHGIAFLPEPVVRRQLAAGTLVEILPDATETGTLGLLWPASRYPLPKVRVFVDFLAGRLAGILAGPADEGALRPRR